MKINHILTQLTGAKFDTVLTDITPWHNKSGTHTYLRTGRVRLYTTLFSRFSSHYSMVVGSVADQYSGGVVMARQQDMKPIQQLASQIFLQ